MNVAASLPKLALDFEPDPASETMQNNAAVFVQLVYQATGEWPLLYTGRGQIVINPILFNCPLWLAEYGNNPICPPGWLSRLSLRSRISPRHCEAPRAARSADPWARNDGDSEKFHEGRVSQRSNPTSGRPSRTTIAAGAELVEGRNANQGQQAEGEIDRKADPNHNEASFLSRRTRREQRPEGGNHDGSAG